MRQAMPSAEMLIELFRQSRRKITPQRRAIVDVLAQGMSHPTAEEIYQRAAITIPDMSRATVYNTLHELVQLGGLIETYESGEGCMRYDANLGPHHHLFCVRCHTLTDIHHDFADVALPAEKAAGYQVARHQITFYGLCPTCQNRESEHNTPLDT